MPNWSFNLICQQEHASLLLTLIPQRSVEAQFEDGVVRVVKNYWSFALTGYGEDFDPVRWRLDLEESLPGRRAVLGRFNDFEWLGINAAAIPGPLVPHRKQQTFVVGMKIMDIFDREGYDHTSEEASRITNKVEALLCIDTDGKVVQKCTDIIGFRLHLCQIGALTVGVDLLQGRWRLWNWVPLSETSFQKLVWLDQHIQRAHVVAGKGEEARDVGYFWLIEESSERVRVSKHDASTLMTIGSDVTVTDMHLLEPQNGSGSLDWHTSIDAMNYQDTLLLLGIDMHDQLVLYQVK